MTTKLKNNPKVKSNLYLEGSLQVLNQVKLVTNHYLTINSTNQDEILLNIYGILQTLFVGVDALYDFVRALTDNKYLININQNDRLHELKFIRNDVVGHPTSRVYSNNRTGFCILDIENMSIEKISYQTYLLDNKSKKVELIGTKEVNLFKLIKAYQEEEEQILRQVELYLENPYSKNIVSSIRRLESMYLNNEDISDEIDKVIAKAISYHTNKEKSQNRLIWRLQLLKKSLDWQSDDPEIKNLIDYISQYQIQKALEIALDITSSYQKIRKIKLPYLLKEFYRSLAKADGKAVTLLQNIHDNKHPFYNQDLLELDRLSDNSSFKKIINILKEETDEQRIYLLGSVLKRYNVVRKKRWNYVKIRWYLFNWWKN